MWVGCSLFWQLCTYLYSFHTQWKSGWLVKLFNPTIPQSVPRSNNLTSSPDKRGFPTRNAASPLSSYLSCLLSHHITSPQTQKQHWQTQHHNTTLNTTRISSLFLSFLSASTLHRHIQCSHTVTLHRSDTSHIRRATRIGHQNYIFTHQTMTSKKYN